MSRGKKIFLLQSLLFIFGVSIIYLTFLTYKNSSEDKILSDKIKLEIDKKIKQENAINNVFYDIQYSGIDLSGNRYILRAKEAINDEQSVEDLKLKFVSATFYFKNDKILNITSESGLYNNLTLDMIFEKNVIGKYEGSIIEAEKAEYYNSKNYLIISDNVKLKDTRGTIVAEKLLFDVQKNTLNISSSGNSKVNANLNYK